MGLEVLIKGWPIILAIISLVGGWATINARVSALEVTSISLSHQFDDAEKERRAEGNSIRESLNDMRVNIVHVCDKIGASCDR